MTGPAHRIILARDPAGFRLTVDPDHPAHPPRTFADYKQARGAAGGLRLVNRWPIDDQVGNQLGGR